MRANCPLSCATAAPAPLPRHECRGCSASLHVAALHVPSQHSTSERIAVRFCAHLHAVARSPIQARHIASCPIDMVQVRKSCTKCFTSHVQHSSRACSHCGFHVHTKHCPSHSSCLWFWGHCDQRCWNHLDRCILLHFSRGFELASWVWFGSLRFLGSKPAPHSLLLL